MNDTQEPSDYHYGIFSPTWMLKCALMYVPRQQLNLALVMMIDEMVYGQDEDVDYLDVLGQVALTGKYVKTREHTEADHDFDPRRRIHDVDEDEVDRQVAEFRAQLDGMPSAQHEPDSLSEDAVEEELQKFQEFLRNIVPKPADDAVDSTEEGGDEREE